MSLFGNVGKALGSVGGIVGDVLNGVTGATSAAQQAQKYTKANMATSQGMTLEQMQKSNEYALQQMAKNYQYEVNSAKNAIQWQMQDLKKAGLNPILAAGYGGANLGGDTGASGVSGGASAPSGNSPMSGMSPIDVLTGITTARKTLADTGTTETQQDVNKSQKELNEALKRKAEVEAGLMPNSAKATIRKQNAEEEWAREKAKTENDIRKNLNSQRKQTESETTKNKGSVEYQMGKVVERGQKTIKALKTNGGGSW